MVLLPGCACCKAPCELFSRPSLPDSIEMTIETSQASTYNFSGYFYVVTAQNIDLAQVSLPGKSGTYALTHYPALSKYLYESAGIKLEVAYANATENGVSFVSQLVITVTHTAALKLTINSNLGSPWPLVLDSGIEMVGRLSASCSANAGPSYSFSALTECFPICRYSDGFNGCDFSASASPRGAGAWLDSTFLDGCRLPVMFSGRYNVAAHHVSPSTPTQGWNEISSTFPYYEFESYPSACNSSIARPTKNRHIYSFESFAKVVSMSSVYGSSSEPMLATLGNPTCQNLSQ